MPIIPCSAMQGELKIADFGLARYLSKAGQQQSADGRQDGGKMTNRVITVWYRCAVQPYAVLELCLPMLVCLPACERRAAAKSVLLLVSCAGWFTQWHISSGPASVE